MTRSGLVPLVAASACKVHWCETIEGLGLGPVCCSAHLDPDHTPGESGAASGAYITSRKSASINAAACDMLWLQGLRARPQVPARERCA